MNKFKIGDLVTVKENFWEIESEVLAHDDMKKLAGTLLEVDHVYSGGNVHTKQDDSNDDTIWYWHKDWLEFYTEPSKEITWKNLKWKDIAEKFGVDVTNIKIKK